MGKLTHLGYGASRWRDLSLGMGNIHISSLAPSATSAFTTGAVVTSTRDEIAARGPTARKFPGPMTPTWCLREMQVQVRWTTAVASQVAS